MIRRFAIAAALMVTALGGTPEQRPEQQLRQNRGAVTTDVQARSVRSREHNHSTPSCSPRRGIVSFFAPARSTTASAASMTRSRVSGGRDCRGTCSSPLVAGHLAGSGQHANAQRDAPPAAGHGPGSGIAIGTRPWPSFGHPAPDQSYPDRTRSPVSQLPVTGSPAVGTARGPSVERIADWSARHKIMALGAYPGMRPRRRSPANPGRLPARGGVTLAAAPGAVRGSYRLHSGTYHPEFLDRAVAGRAGPMARRNGKEQGACVQAVSPSTLQSLGGGHGSGGYGT